MNDAESVATALEQHLPAAVEFLRQTVGINSYTTNRQGVERVAQLTARQFEALGFTAETVPSTDPAFAGHLVLTRRGKGKHNLALISHLDTVFPPEEEERNNFHWQPEGDRIFGPGTQDIKGGTAMMWLIVMALRANAPIVFEEMTWNLLLNSSEERFSPGFGDL